MKLTKWHLNPVNLLCLILLSITTVTVLTANKPAKDAPGIEIGRQDDEYYQTHPLTIQDMKEYQFDVVNDKYVILYKFNKVVNVIPLDEKCNLTIAILKDNL